MSAHDTTPPGHARPPFRMADPQFYFARTPTPMAGLQPKYRTREMHGPFESIAKAREGLMLLIETDALTYPNHRADGTFDIFNLTASVEPVVKLHVNVSLKDV